MFLLDFMVYIVGQSGSNRVIIAHYQDIPPFFPLQRPVNLKTYKNRGIDTQFIKVTRREKKKKKIRNEDEK